MGKLNHDPSIQHFSHPHPLNLCNIDQQQVQITAQCSGCKLQSSGYMYTCWPCNFTLHLSCSQFPRLITHPCHPNHNLTLLSVSAYPEGLFNCDACNQRGNGFSYNCTHCNFDLHVLCASKPLTTTHQLHPHPLELTFKPPYQSKGFSCDICRQIGSKQWLYRCSACEFDVHLDCAAPKPKPVIGQPQQLPLQHHHSFPAATHTQFPAPVPLGHGSVSGAPNYLVHSASTGALNHTQPRPAYGSGNSLTNAVVEGVVEGAAQQVGQNIIQSMIGGVNGGGGGSYDPGSGATASVSVLDVGSSILSSMFWDEESQK